MRSDEPSPSPAESTVRVSPYVVFRRSRLPVAGLEDLRFDETWARIEESRLLREDCARRAGEVSDRLAGCVPQVAASVRAELVRLRRDIYNQRAEPAARRVGLVEPHLDAETLARVREWFDLVQRTRRCEDEARTLFEDRRRSARASFARILEHDSMARSIQLSGDQLYESLRRYTSGEMGSVKPSRSRVLESSLVNFAYRAALKPSPFGRFTEVGAFPPDLPAVVGDAVPESRTYSTSTLNRVLVNWLAAGLRRIDGGIDLCKVLLNSSLRVDDKKIEFIGLVPDSSEYGLSESIVRLKRDKVVDCLLAVLATGTASVPEVLRALTVLTGSDATSRKALRAMMRIELLYVSPGFDEQHPEYSEKVAGVLRAGTTRPVSVLSGHLDTLREVETKLSDAPAEKRGLLLKAAEHALTDVAEVCEMDPPPAEISRAPVYEDLWTPDRPATWSRDAVAASVPALESLWRLSSLLDYGHTKRLGMYHFAATTYGDRETVPFLTFFDKLVSLSESEQDAVFWGHESAAAETFVAQRAQALRDIGEQLVPEDGVVRMTPEALKAACAGVEDCVDPDSITFRVQFAGGTPSPDIVVNGVLTGYGVYFSRFSSFVQGSAADDWTLRTAVREHLRKAFPGQVDLNMVAGLNFNLHPPLTDRVLNYPGTWPTAPEMRAYSLDRLAIRIDHANRGVLLWDPELDERVHLAPMNFMLPIVVPVLYNLLEVLSPTIRYNYAPMDDIGRATGHRGYPGSSPRLMVGDVVASRRTWTVPARDIPELVELSKDSYPALLRFDQWRREQGLPQHAFVLTQRLDEYNLLSGLVEEIPRDWSDFRHLTRASVHKPMYVDFRNPYLVRSFAKSALTRDDVYASIRECVPAPDEYGGSGPAAAEEFFVELYRD
ncbi:Lantibiotic dehydratase, C terminus [Streptomyces yunnanensis]|uniref:Lantibiotic dehydratase, C terminus n=1 Tax=Streptomyces yunnanensis TaxID=156453 RepID=A0A9X8QRY6_9ACTN|nr:Lantibiotic dehydratase, C terminus [Streptomyces yunnanensis]